MLSQFHLNVTYNYNYIKRSLATNSPNYVRATYTIWGYIKKRSLTTNCPNYVKATYTKLVA